MPSSFNLFTWLGTHLPMLGWGFLIGTCAKFVHFVTKLGSRFDRAEETLNTLANNHLKHIQDSMASVDGNMKEVRDGIHDLRDDVRQFLLVVIKR